eukprot:15356412-Alexandrium_andersonii.AAC.1
MRPVSLGDLLRLSPRRHRRAEGALELFLHLRGPGRCLMRRRRGRRAPSAGRGMRPSGADGRRRRGAGCGRGRGS